MKTKFLILLYSLFSFFSCINKSKAQIDYDIFYLTIGSEHYEKEQSKFDEGFIGLNNLEAARNSAEKMTDLFIGMGARSGRQILSLPSTYITKKGIFDNLNSLIKEVNKSRAKNPLIIVYYAGHGFSSGDYKTHFNPPGDFVKNPVGLQWEDWLEFSISPLKIREVLEESKLSYMMLFDCCYEGEQRQQVLLSHQVQENTGTKTAMELFGDVGDILNNLNTMTGPDPVIFSCEPGLSVLTDLYDFGEGRVEVAPLCRRIHLILDEKLKEENVTVSDLVIMLKSEDLDARTGPAFTTWSFDAKNLNYLWRK